MARPKKDESDKQTEKIVVYVTSETKQEVKKAVAEMSSSESKIGDLAIRKWLGSQGGASTMQYGQLQSGADLTGPLSGADLIFQKPVDISFNCELEDESWVGKVTWIAPHGTHLEFSVEGRGSSFRAIAGPTVSGWFLALPVDEVCLDLGSPTDTFYNEEKVLRCAHLNRIDGISSVSALKALYKAGYLTTLLND